jgi:hypothetical protein
VRHDFKTQIAGNRQYVVLAQREKRIDLRGLSDVAVQSSTNTATRYVLTMERRFNGAAG